MKKFKTKKEVRVLQCQLSDEDRISITNELQKSFIKLDEIKADFELAKTNFKTLADPHQKSIEHKLKLIKDGFLEKDVECEWSFDFKSGIKTLVRQDTGEIVTETEILEEERQEELL